MVKLEIEIPSQLVKLVFVITDLVISGVMVAWTGLEHFRVGRYDPPPPADEPDDIVVCFKESVFKR